MSASAFQRNKQNERHENMYPRKVVVEFDLVDGHENYGAKRGEQGEDATPTSKQIDHCGVVSIFLKRVRICMRKNKITKGGWGWGGAGGNSDEDQQVEITRNTQFVQSGNTDLKFFPVRNVARKTLAGAATRVCVERKSTLLMVLNSSLAACSTPL